MEEVLVAERRVKGVRLANGEELLARQVIIAPGRDGSEWLASLLRAQGLPLLNNQVDIGDSVGTRVRTFCANPSGHVVLENHTGVMTANGHSYKDPALGSANTNFALLVSHQFTEVTPGLASEHTLFYGVEAKFDSARPRLTNHFETEIGGLYAIGDGAGITRGLAQASAAGVHVARHIVAERV